MSSLGINQLLNQKNKEQRMPTLFIGHGSPMNALANNTFTQALERIGNQLPRPDAILCVSAHWMTQGGTAVTKMENPPTIHDFYGFPKELFEVQYPAPGKPEIADLVQSTVTAQSIFSDTEQWGLDHGTWSVLRHMYPSADIPVLQLSIDMTKTPEQHFNLGQELSSLRDKGVMIIGSGNIVHNLRKIQWDPQAKPFDWALEYDAWIKKNLEERNFKALHQKFLNSEAGKLSNPTLDHYLPMLYVLGAGKNEPTLTTEYEEIQNSSISMRTFRFG